jgi:molecular chaperone DnaK
MATYGIDLGTTYSCIAYIDDVGRPAIAKTEMGEDTLPSVVYFESAGNVIVGRTAKNSALLHPDLVVSLIKRQMGKPVDRTFHGEAHTAETISALILKELARAAELVTREPVRDAVITVPAYFGVAEREATRKAGEIAGLNVLNLVPEPVAAALHYEMLAGGSDRTILVYDLGGGTFDTTVIRLEGADVQVVCTDGASQLGGADWDSRLVDYLLEQFVAAHPHLDPSGDELFLQDLSIAAEQLKRDLSNATSRRHVMRFDGAVHEVELKRELFEELTSVLLDTTLDITERTVALARDRGADRFDDVLLVGGATKMPAVPRRLQERFGFEALRHDPDLAVAKGAARFALIESIKIHVPTSGGETPAASRPAVEETAATLGLTTEQVEEFLKKKITTVVPRAFGIKVLDSDDPKLEREYVDHLLEANAALPADSGPRKFATVAPNQTEIEIQVWEQGGAIASKELEHNNRIGEGRITGLPPLPAGSPVEVTATMDAIGTLRVHAVELRTGKDLEIELTIGGMDAASVEAARTAIARYTVSE